MPIVYCNRKLKALTLVNLTDLVELAGYTRPHEPKWRRMSRYEHEMLMYLIR